MSDRERYSLNRLQPRKKIAIVTQDPANRGGVLRLVRYMYDRVLEAGAAPVLLHYASFKVWPALSVSSQNTLRGKMITFPKLKQYSFEGMDAIAIGAWFPEWEPNRIASNPLWQKQLKEFDAAILVTGSAHTGLPLVESGTKYLAWVSSTVEHDRRERLAISTDLESRVERMGLSKIKRAEQEVLAHASKVLAVSNDAAKSLTQIMSSIPRIPIISVPFPIDTLKFNPGTRKYERSQPILFVGRAGDPRKRIGLFLGSLCEVRKLSPQLNFKAIVVSSMPISNGLKSQQRSILDRVEIISSISEQELVDLYRSASMLVVTSEQEGLGIAAMEAMACGTPVISTRCGGPETFIEDGSNGFLTSSNPNEIAGQILSLLTNEVQANTLGEQAATTIESTFSEHVWNAKFVMMIQELMGT